MALKCRIFYRFGSLQMIKITIPGEPVAQGRPRFSRQGGFIRTYDPKPSRDYKAKIQQCVARLKLTTQLDQPLAVTIKVYRPIQKSTSKKDRALKIAGKILPTTKPDTDNYVKGILDGLSQSEIWTDDNLICVIKAQKMYSEYPRAEIEIKEIEV